MTASARFQHSPDRTHAPLREVVEHYLGREAGREFERDDQLVALQEVLEEAAVAGRLTWRQVDWHLRAETQRVDLPDDDPELIRLRREIVIALQGWRAEGCPVPAVRSPDSSSHAAPRSRLRLTRLPGVGAFG